MSHILRNTSESMTDGNSDIDTPMICVTVKMARLRAKEYMYVYIVLTY